MTDKIKQFIRLKEQAEGEMGTQRELTVPRELAFRKKDAISMWGEGNFTEMKMGPDDELNDFKPQMEQNKLVSDETVVKDRVEKVRAHKDKRAKHQSDQYLNNLKVTAKTHIDPAKSWDDLTPFERRLKDGIGEPVTDAEVRNYIKEKTNGQ